MTPADRRVIAGKYEVVRLLGQGGMGAVYEARHVATGRRVAVKVILGEALAHSPSHVQRFQREARAASSIESQHIAHVYDAGFDAQTGHPYMALEYLEGNDVEKLLVRNGPMRPSIALKMVGQACVGLSSAHAAGVVHRDIKPANLFVTRSDGRAVVMKLLDFGIAKISIDQMTASDKGALTRTGAMLGSPLYMSPEQARGERDIDARTDVWSLGLVLYELLTGRSPFAAADTLGALILAICATDVPGVRRAAPWVPREVEAVVERALRRERAERFQSMNEMLAAILAQVPDGLTLVETAITPLTPDEIHAATSALLPSGHGTTTAAPTAARTSRSATRVSGKVRLAAIGAAVATAVAGVALYVAPFLRGAHSPALDPYEARAPGVGDGANISAESAARASPLAANAVRVVPLSIAPPSSRVEIDGVPVATDAGVASLSGVLGSTHKVRVRDGANEAQKDVTITSSGAEPARVELAALPTSAPADSRRAAGAHAPNRRPGPPGALGAARSEASTSAPPASPAPASSGPPREPQPASPGEPSIGRKME